MFDRHLGCSSRVSFQHLSFLRHPKVKTLWVWNCFILHYMWEQTSWTHQSSQSHGKTELNHKGQISASIAQSESYVITCMWHWVRSPRNRIGWNFSQVHGSERCQWPFLAWSEMISKGAGDLLSPLWEFIIFIDSKFNSCLFWYDKLDQSSRKFVQFNSELSIKVSQRQKNNKSAQY